jgi:hypothetical protein
VLLTAHGEDCPYNHHNALGVGGGGVGVFLVCFFWVGIKKPKKNPRVDVFFFFFYFGFRAALQAFPDATYAGMAALFIFFSLSDCETTEMY